MKTAFAFGRLVVLVLLATLLIEPIAIDDLVLRHVLRTVVLLWLIVEVALLFSRTVIHNGKLGSGLRNSVTSVFGLSVCMVFLEIACMYLPRSHGVGYTYAARNWFYYFWRTNELGYRDKPVAEVDLEKPRVIVLGDSFTAGHGIRSSQDTYAGQLGLLLNNQAEVLNLGRNGSDSRDALRRLQQYPLRPDLLVLQYFGNDIEVVASEHGVDPTSVFEPYRDVNVVERTLVLSSYLSNFAYWLFPHGDADAYANSLFSAYSDPATLRSHLDDLNRIVSYAKDNGVPLVVVLFPLLTDLKRSRLFTEPVGDFFKDRGVPLVDVQDLVLDLPVGSRIINSNDSHASARVHRIVAESLVELIMAQQWLDVPQTDATVGQSR